MKRSRPSGVRHTSSSVSRGMISSRTKPRIQSSFASNSGSVEKSHAMAPPSQSARRGNLPGVVELVLTVGVLAFVGFRLAGAARHSFTAAGRCDDRCRSSAASAGATSGRPRSC